MAGRGLDYTEKWTTKDLPHARAHHSQKGVSHIGQLQLPPKWVRITFVLFFKIVILLSFQLNQHFSFGFLHISLALQSSLLLQGWLDRLFFPLRIRDLHFKVRYLRSQMSCLLLVLLHTIPELQIETCISLICNGTLNASRNTFLWESRKLIKFDKNFETQQRNHQLFSNYERLKEI